MTFKHFDYLDGEAGIYNLLITNQRRTMGRIPYGGIDRLADDR
jgi:hypothetical protein